MPKGRPRREPSGRNLELYHELVCEGRLQEEVAARFRVSQPRVALVRREVSAWVEETLAAELGSSVAGGDPGSRLHLAIALWRRQLTDAYRAYLDLFGGADSAKGYGHLLAASDAGLLPDELAAKLPRPRFVQRAVRMARELDELERVAGRGPFASLPDELREIEREFAPLGT